MSQSPKRKPLRPPTLRRLISLFHDLLPLSMRGVLMLWAMGYLILSPIINQSDIVASMIVALLLGLIIFVVATSSICGFRFRRGAKFDVHPPTRSKGDLHDKVISQSEADYLVACSNITIPPFFHLRLSLKFLEDDEFRSFHIISGKLDKNQPLVMPITFPHRGLWQLAGLEVSLEDSFGITSQSWLDTSAAEQSIEVFPAACKPPQLPIISATFRAGDDVAHHTQRMGELFDLKPYHPADGIKRILWKVFAKRGELIARHPEQAVSPEGHVIAFILAKRSDDALAAWAIAYFQEIEALNLTMEVGCSGMLTNEPLAQSASSLEHLLVRSAFIAPESLSNEVRINILSIVQNRQIFSSGDQASSIALFISESLLSSKQSASDLLELIDLFEQNHYSIAVCLQKELSANQEEAASDSLLKRILLTRPADFRSSPILAEEGRALFLNACALKNLTVLQEKSFARGVR